MFGNLRKSAIQLRAVIALILLPSISLAQVYKQDFGTTTINAPTYVGTPVIMNQFLSNSLWTNSNGNFTSYAHNPGVAIGLANTANSPYITLTFDVAPNKQLNITKFNFFRQRSSSGPQTWTMLINGTQVGNGSVPTTGADIGDTDVSTPITGLTGTVTVRLNLGNGGSGATFRLDDFTLYGDVTSTCTQPVISAITPASGPANTRVMLTGTGFTGASAVTLNGTPVTYQVISNTQIVFTAPAGGTNGAIKVTSNSCDSDPTGAFTYVAGVCPPLTGLNEIFISEIFDDERGEGGVIEIYNPTTATVDMSQYAIEHYIDWASTSSASTNPLTGMLPPGGIYLVKRTQNLLTCNPATIYTSGLNEGFNDNDKLDLIKNGVVIDRVRTPNNTGFSMLRLATATPLPSATYIAAQWNISNEESCTDVGIYSMPGTPQASITAQPQNQVQCSAGTATFTATVQGGSGFVYQWKTLDASGNWVNVVNNTVYNGAQTASLTVNVSAALDGTQYYLEITSTTCTLISDAATLTVGTGPSTPTFSTSLITCLAPTSVLTVVAVANMQYSVDGSNYTTTPVFVGLNSGQHTLYVKNASGCITSVQFTIAPAAGGPAVPTYTVTAPTCTVPTGTITVDPVPGAGLEYSIDGTTFSSNNVFAGLTAGNTYTITVRNATNCTNTVTVTIGAAPAAPAVPTYTVTAPTCTVPTGTITVDPMPGAGLEYSIDGTTFSSNNVFAGLTAGNTYTITVRNATNCTNTVTATIGVAPAAPAVPTYTVTAPTCTVPTGTITVDTVTGTTLNYSIDGINFSTSHIFSGLTAGTTYTITVRNTAGCLNTVAVTIAPVPVAPAVPTYAVTPANCTIATATITVTTVAGLEYSIDGTTFGSNNVFAGLAANNTYTVTVRNAAGCTNSALVTVAPAPVAPATPTYTLTAPTCTVPTGTITVAPVTGTTLDYSIDGTTFSTNHIFSGLTAGATYTVTARNAAGCTNSVQVTIAAAPTMPEFIVFEGCAPTANGKHFTFELTSQTGYDLTTLSYQWKNANGAVVATNGPVFDITDYARANNINTFPYVLKLTITTPQGCSEDYQFTAPGTACDIPRGISPNNDTYNDYFDLSGFNVEKLTIFNRYGLEVYHKNNYLNEWYGQTDKGDELPTGTYFYVVKTASETKTGWVYINRQL